MPASPEQHQPYLHMLQARLQVAFSAEAVLLDLKPHLESVCNTHVEDSLECRMLATSDVHRLKQACKASLGALNSSIRQAARAAEAPPPPPHSQPPATTSSKVR